MGEKIIYTLHTSPFHMARINVYIDDRVHDLLKKRREQGPFDVSGLVRRALLRELVLEEVERAYRRLSRDRGVDKKILLRWLEESHGARLRILHLTPEKALGELETRATADYAKASPWNLKPAEKVARARRGAKERSP